MPLPLLGWEHLSKVAAADVRLEAPTAWSMSGKNVAPGTLRELLEDQVPDAHEQL